MQAPTSTRATLLAASLFVGGLITGALTGRAAVARAQDPYAQLDLFARVLTTIQEDFVEPIPPEDLIDAAIRGMVGRLDRQSRWLDSDQLQELRDDAEGTTTGLGIEVARSADGVEVVRILEGSPALRDGLVPGDRILAVDGRELTGLDLDQIEAELSGDRGQSATLTVLRHGWDAPREIETVRDRVRRRVIRGELVAEGIAYIHLAQFQEGTARDLMDELTLLAEPLGGIDRLSGLIIDVRDNPGGLLSEAVAVVDLFLDDGVIVSTRARNAGDVAESHRASVGGLPESLATVVLINGMSASASEILAGALQDTQRGILVGEPTYGKGTVQKVYLHSSPQESALKLTVGRYFTPSGAPVAPKEGRMPDHLVAHPAPPGPVAALRARLDALDLADPDRTSLLALLDELPPERSQPPGDPVGSASRRATARPIHSCSGGSRSSPAEGPLGRGHAAARPTGSQISRATLVRSPSVRPPLWRPGRPGEVAHRDLEDLEPPSARARTTSSVLIRAPELRTSGSDRRQVALEDLEGAVDVPEPDPEQVVDQPAPAPPR